MRETLEAPDSPKEIVYTRVTAAFPVRTENGASENICVRVLYRTQRGSLSSMSRVLTLTFEGGGTTGMTLPETARFGEVYAAAGDGAVELLTRRGGRFRAHLCESNGTGGDRHRG